MHTDHHHLPHRAPIATPVPIGYRMPTVERRRLYAGCRMLSVGGRLSAVGCRMLNVERRPSAVGRWTLNVGCWTLLSLLFLLPLPAAEPAAPALVIPAPHFDAGTVTNRFLTHAFTLRNAGAAPLAITRIRACCGATCQLAATNLPPAATTELQVRLDLAGRSGAFRKTIYLHTSDPVRPIAAVRLTGTFAGTPIAANSDFDAAAWRKQMGGRP